MNDLDNRRVLAIASGGGHWCQLMRLRPALRGLDVHYATVSADRAVDVPEAPLWGFRDANREDKPGLLLQLLQIAWIVVRVRPDVVISTGASCGYFAIRLARLFGARTLFIDSLANAEQLSMSGQLVAPHADVLLTQWSHLQGRDGAQHWGAVL